MKKTLFVFEGEKDMRRFKNFGFWTAILILVFCVLHFACATLSTHIWVPFTYVQPFKRWHITSDFYVPTENDANDVRMDIDF